MVNTDKVKSARKGGMDPATKAQQINDAQQKAFDKARRLKAVQNVSINAEDAVRLTEHEENMRAQKLKREAKKAKAAEFRARAEAAAAVDIVEDDFAARSAPSPSIAAPSAAAGLQVSRHVLQKNGAKTVLTEEQLRSQVASLVGSRQAKVAPRTAPPPPQQQQPPPQTPKPPQQPPPPPEVDHREELQLDAYLDHLVEQGTLSEAQVDRLTDRIARGELTVLQCLRPKTMILALTR